MATMMASRKVSGAEVESFHLIYKYKGGGGAEEEEEQGKEEGELQLDGMGF